MVPTNMRQEPSTFGGLRSSTLPSTPGAILLSLGVLGLALLLLADLAERNPGFTALASILTVVLLAPIVVAAARRKFFALEPIYLCVLMYAYIYLVKPTTRLMYEDQFAYGGHEDLDWVMFVVIVGLLAFYAGYYLKTADRLAGYVPTMSAEISSVRLRLLAWMFIVVGALGLWVYMEHSGGWRVFWSVPHGYGGDTDALSAYVYQLPELMVVGFFLIVFDAITRPKIDPATIIRVLIASIGGIGVYSILWSRRTFILWAIISVFILYFLRKRRTPSIAMIALLGGVAFTAVVLALAYRPYLHLGSTWDDFSAVHPSEYVRNTLSQEGDEFDSALAIASLYPEQIPYDYFSIYARIPLHPIPRAIWPDKPPLFVDSWDDFIFHSGIGWGASESVIGDFYIQLGLLGVIIGMFASGVLWRFFYAYLQRAPTSGFMQLVYGVALGNVPTFFAQSAVSAFWKWFPLMIPSIVLTYLLVRKRR